MTDHPDTLASAEGLARFFHETYERLAPEFGYETREASRTDWANVPEQNKALMIAVAGEVRAALAAHDQQDPDREQEYGEGIAEFIRERTAEHAATWKPHGAGFVPDGTSLAAPDVSDIPEPPSQRIVREQLPRLHAKHGASGQPDPDDELLARAEKDLRMLRACGHEPAAGLVTDLIAALRHKRLALLIAKKAREFDALDITRLERELAEARSEVDRLTQTIVEWNAPHGEVLAREVTQALKDRDEPGLSFVFTELAVDCPPGTEVLVVRATADQEATDD